MYGLTGLLTVPGVPRDERVSALLDAFTTWQLEAKKMAKAGPVFKIPVL